jgi:two-component system LytT family response regulator
MNVLLVDDESLARRRLRRLLSDAPDVTVVAECGSGSAAIEALKTHQVDIVFQDIDYLLKPVRAERLALALDRAREALAARRSAAYARQLRSVIAQLDQEPSAAPRPASSNAAERIEVRDGERVRYVAADDVAWAEADGPHVRLHTAHGVFEIRETLAHLEAALDARRFVRIHRSFIVNVGQIKELQPWFGGDAVLILKNGQQLKVSRTYRAQLKQRLNAL